MTIQPGQMLAHYRLIGKIGQGGMGEVHLAEDTRLHREVAIKVLPPDLAADAGRLARFRREAESVAALSHPNIVTVFSIEEQDGIHFMALELVRGQSLAGLIPKGGLPVERLLDLATALTDAVSAAHQQGITHRDLKPENVMVGEDGRLKVLDFGLAKLAEPPGDGAAATQLPTTARTEEGKVMGTVAYMSPEQAEGKPVDPRSDVFSLGVVLYQMATGVRPFRGDSTASVISSILRDTPPPPSEINELQPRGLDRIVRRCLAKDPARRYQVALEIRNELEILKEELAAGEGAETGLEAAPPVARSAALPVIVTAVVTLGLAAAAWLMLGRGAAPTAEGPFHGSFRRITSGPGAEVYPSVSPDGTDLAYASAAAGNWDIWVQRVGGRNAINLTADSQDDETSPAFSPDGQSIVFRSERAGGGLFIMGATGESTRRLTDRGCNPAWSPDGREIAYTTECFEAPTGRGTHSELWVVDVATGEERRIQTTDAVQPSWSPSGRWIAFWAVPGGSGQRDLWIIPSQGGEAIRLTDDGAVDWNPVWSPDGEWIYFSSDRGGNMSLWRLPMHEASGRVLGDPEPVTMELSGRSQHISLAASGNRLVFSSRVGMYGVQRLPFDPAGLRVAGAPRWVFPPSPESITCDPSGDGRRFVCSNEGSVQEDIWVINADGTGRRQLTDDPARDRRPRWGTGGQRIFFYSDRSGTYEIWSVNADGSGLQRLTDTPGRSTIYAVPSPRGRVLAQSLTSENRPFIFDPDTPFGEQELEVLPPLEGDSVKFVPWSWSPGGRYLVGDVTPGWPEMEGVAVYDVEEGSYRRLEVPGRGPVWLPGGRTVVTTSPHTLLTVDVSSGEAREAIAFHPDTILNLSTYVAEGGRAIYYTRLVAEADVWLLEWGGDGKGSPTS